MARPNRRWREFGERQQTEKIADCQYRHILKEAKKHDRCKIGVPPIGGRTCCRWRQAAETVLNSFDKKSKKVLWESIILKLKSCGRKYANFESFLKDWKQSTCIFFTFLVLAKWPILHFKTAHFTSSNESFYRAKRPILRCKMSHFENEEKIFSIFVRFFYPNKRFRLPRMKKWVDRIFR